MIISFAIFVLSDMLCDYENNGDNRTGFYCDSKEKCTPRYYVCDNETSFREK